MSTPVQAPVEPMLSAKSSTTTPSAPVLVSTAEIHSTAAAVCRRSRRRPRGRPSRVSPRRVAPMLSAERSTATSPAPACQASSELLPTVGRSVSSMRSVPVTRPASSRSVQTPVLEPVDTTLDVLQSITTQSAPVLRNILETRSQAVLSPLKW